MSTKHTLPSGLEIELGDYRTWLGADVQDVWDSLYDPDEPIRLLRTAILRKLITWSSDPAKLPVPATEQALAGLRADDYVAVFNLPEPLAAQDLVTGKSVIPNLDDFGDPTQPSPDTSASSPG